MSMNLTNLPVSRETITSTPAIVILVTYCTLLKLVISCMVEAEPRGLRSAGEKPERACRGNIAALTLTDRSRIVRSNESGIKERIEERMEEVRNKRRTDYRRCQEHHVNLIFAQPRVWTKKDWQRSLLQKNLLFSFFHKLSISFLCHTTTHSRKDVQIFEKIK